MFNCFFSPNTSDLNEGELGKTVITKKQIIESGHQDVRSLLEYSPGVDVYGDGPRGQKTSIFMRGTNSNHTLVLLNGIPINDQSSPKAMFDFGYDFLQGLQQVEIYKGASGAIFGPAAIGGAINFVTAIDYQIVTRSVRLTLAIIQLVETILTLLIMVGIIILEVGLLR